jgi:hypothetical protein
MPNDPTQTTEFESENDEKPFESQDDEKNDIENDDEDAYEDDDYEINVIEALSQDIRGNKPMDPEKVDKANRLGLDVGVDAASLPPKKPKTING